MVSDFGGLSFDYDPMDDPYAERQVGFKNWDIKIDPNGRVAPKYILFSELKEALLGIVEHPSHPAVACYSSSMTLAILKSKHGLTEPQARLALEQLLITDIGPEAPCFLDTSIIEE
jgi:hypothetical protein|tara:strand:+ start:1123 stop:1470 length:348 start_codon:yes stop_codon:yes gene_type:complete